MNLLYIVSINKFNVKVFTSELEATLYIKFNKKFKPFGFSTNINNPNENIQHLYYKNKWSSLKELPIICKFSESAENINYTLTLVSPSNL